MAGLFVLQLVTLVVLAWMGWGLVLIGNLLRAHSRQVREHIEAEED